MKEMKKAFSCDRDRRAKARYNALCMAVERREAQARAEARSWQILTACAALLLICWAVMGYR